MPLNEVSTFLVDSGWVLVLVLVVAFFVVVSVGVSLVNTNKCSSK
jgi:hypothetical protein